MAIEIDEVLDEVEWWKLWYFMILREVDCGVVINSEGKGTFLTGDLVEKLNSRGK